MKTFKEQLRDNHVKNEDVEDRVIRNALWYWAFTSGADLTRDDTLEALVTIAAIAYYVHSGRKSTLFGEMPTESYVKDPSYLAFPASRHAITADLMKKVLETKYVLEAGLLPNFSGEAIWELEEIACVDAAGIVVNNCSPCTIKELGELVQSRIDEQGDEEEDI